MMKRKIYQVLLEWKNKRQGETALMIEGARRVGKSYIVEEFAKKEYDSYIIVDFNNIDAETLDIFEQYLPHLDQFFQLLQIKTGTRLLERKSLIVFDEVQLYPKARAAIKYPVKDGRYDYIETGLPVSIKKNTKGIVIPSEEHTLQMYPMDFEEALPPPCGRACCRRHCGLFLRRLLYSFSILPQGRWSAGLTQRLDLLNPKSDY